MNKWIKFLFMVSVLALEGCGWIQTLRREIDEDERDPVRAADYDYYKNPANRYVPPPPANVFSDAKAQAVAGSPVDLSGTRAKQLRTTAKDFLAESAKNENSLWAEDGQNNYLFARNKLKAPGDLVTVMIEDNLRKDMVDSVKRLLPPEYRDQEIRVPGLTKDQGGEQKSPGAAGAEGAKTDDSELAASDMLTAEVLERYPNGNVRLRGIKRVPFKHNVRNIEVVAICKGTDISENDIVKSSRFFDQHVEIYK